MLIVNIPSNNIPEREYIIKVLLSDFLGLKYDIIINKSIRDYVLKFDNKKIIIKDGFFGNYAVSLSYLNRDSIPEKAGFIKNRFVLENDIPIIYGSDTLLIEGNTLTCGIDVFASSFFLLTRWEEYVIERRDEHDRFPGEESFMWKNNILYRPVVNEYVEMLWNLMIYMGYREDRRRRDFELILTHDVDALTYVSYRSIMGDIIKRRDPVLAYKNIKYALNKDPFDTYDFLMNVSEKLGVRSHFYFMATDSGLKYDTSWYIKRKKFSSIIKMIKERGHVIGFHPGYYTYNDPERWRYEKRLLENAIGQEVKEGRQHFLRMDMPGTLNIWNENKMEIDSSLGYSGKEGFRCGTGDTFFVFDFLNRKQLNLRERPLIIMDGMLRQSQNYSVEKARETIRYYTSLTKRYKTEITILFHNSSFFGEWKGYDSVYRELLNI